MVRNETDMLLAKKAGVIKADADAHQISMDIRTIVKGCVFEWCLTDGKIEIRETLSRILSAYLRRYMK